METSELSCIRLVVCRRALVDRASNLVSYIDVVDDVVVDPGVLGTKVNLSVEAELVGQGSYEVALSWTDQDNASYRASDGGSSVFTELRTRVSLTELILPPKAGTYILSVEYRRSKEDAWVKTGTGYVLSVRLPESPVEQAPVAPVA